MKISECKVGMLVKSAKNPHFVWKIEKILTTTLHVSTVNATVNTYHKNVRPSYLFPAQEEN